MFFLYKTKRKYILNNNNACWNGVQSTIVSCKMLEDALVSTATKDVIIFFFLKKTVVYLSYNMTFSLSPSASPGPGSPYHSARNSRSARTLHAIKEGWVYKKGGQSFSGFKRRYCILWTNKRLEYYTNDKLSTMKGSVCLDGLPPKAVQRQNEKLPKPSKDDENRTVIYSGFRVDTKKRMWYFAVKTHDIRDEWIQTIRAMLDEVYSSAYQAQNKMPSNWQVIHSFIH